MCIRDSRGTRGLVHGGRAAPAHPAGREPVRECRGRLDSGPVSYTHLRAHETVLDLVCRLLLEKKNKYNNEGKFLLTTQRNYKYIPCG